MTRNSPPVALALALVVALATVGAQQDPEPGASAIVIVEQNQEEQDTPIVFRIGVEMVSVSVTATDRRGRMVTDLKMEDFIVLENGRPQTIVNFHSARESTPVGIGVGILLDASGSMSADKINSMQVAVDELMGRLKREDEFYMVEFANVPELVIPWTTDRRQVINQIRRIKTRPGTAIYDSIMYALPISAAGEQKKQVILVLTDGADYNSKTPRSEVARAAAASDVLIYAVVLDGEQGVGSRGGSMALRQAAAELGQVTVPTGGATYYVQGFQELQDVLKSLGTDVSQQYFLEYQREGDRDGQFRRIEVGVKRENVMLRHRNGYVAD